MDHCQPWSLPEQLRPHSLSQSSPAGPSSAPQAGLTHTTLLLTEGLGPKLLLSSSGDSELPRGVLAGSSRSSRFPRAAAVGRADRE